MNYRDILASLPHRYPFLLVDKVTDISDSTIHGVKNVSFHEPHFMGHFPENPVFPGVLIVESLAQLSGIFIIKKYSQSKEQTGLFAGIEEFSFKGIVRPGDQMILQSELVKKKFTVFLFKVTAKVEDSIVAVGKIKVILSPKGR